MLLGKEKERRSSEKFRNSVTTLLLVRHVAPRTKSTFALIFTTNVNPRPHRVHTSDGVPIGASESTATTDNDDGGGDARANRGDEARRRQVGKSFRSARRVIFKPPADPVRYGIVYVVGIVVRSPASENQ